MITLPSNLVDAVREQRAILFLGAGASFGAAHPTSDAVPVGNKLRDLICDKFLNGKLKERSLAAVAEFAANERDLRSVQNYVYEVFDPFTPAEFHLLLPRFRWRAIATTNYDLIVERAYAKGQNLQEIVKFVKDGSSFDQELRKKTDPLPLVKLHGCIEFHSDESVPLILGQEQYTKYEKNRKRLYEIIRGLAQEYHIIFCGYRIEDPHIQKILFDLTDNSVSRPMFFSVSPSFDDVETRYWSSKRVTCIRSTFEEFLTALDQAIPQSARALSVDIGGGTLSLRSHYRVAHASESGTLRAFLEKDVLHVRDGMTIEGQQPRRFYEGYDTGWGCVVQNLDAHRTLTDSVLVDAVLLDEAKRKRVELFVIKGPAGNGKTVCLKRIAWEAAVSYENIVLFHLDGGALRHDAIAEIYQLTGKRIFLVVDKLALNRHELRRLLQYCESNDISLTAIGAERDGEWNNHCAALEKYVRQDFALRYLNEGEIDELLILLERHGALGLLQEKTAQQRKQAFTEQAQRQLLVALHEATLGKPFETIIQEEFLAIEPQEAQSMYLDICALHQFGVNVRAGLISRLTGVTFEDFHERLISPLKNIVFVHTDQYSGDYYYSSRHQHIAEIVFHACLPDPEEKFNHLTAIIDEINPEYSSDFEAFQRIIRGHNVKSMFANVELGRLIYDKASALAPEDPFIYQQRAIFEMNHAGGSLPLAEQHIQYALSLRGGNAKIQHTSAEIARRQASAATDPLKKAAFRRAAYDRIGTIGTRHSPEYQYHTLSLLALEELRETLGGASYDAVRDDKAVIAAAKKVQNAIEGGLQHDPDSPTLRSTEAEFRELIDQSAQAIKVLEKAFNGNPRQDWIAVRLADRYRASGDVQGALTTLSRCLDVNPGSKLAHLTYARLLSRQDPSNPLILDHLRSSFSNGDGRYDAQFWYARELIVRGSYSDALALFDAIHERAPSEFRRSPRARIRGAEVPKVFRGRVERKEEGYAFLKVIPIPESMFASKAESDEQIWKKIATGNEIVCEIAFNRRGPQAVNVVPRDT